MWRGLFLGLGLTACIVGAQCLAVEKAVLNLREETPANDFFTVTGLSNLTGSPPALGRKREIVPPEWVPWSLLGGGAVVMLYSFTIPRRVSSD